VPELIQDDFTPGRVAGALQRFLSDTAYADETRQALGEVRARLGGPGASARAASMVIETAQRRRQGRDR
jgi:lipid-A-disaccharide synthase